jgi:hypothetical protein
MAAFALLQSGMPEDELVAVRSEALSSIAEYGEQGCRPKELSKELLFETMEFLACKPLSDRMADRSFKPHFPHHRY